MTADELRAVRDDLGYSRTELGAALGVDQATVWRWEQGQRAIPSYLPLALDTLLWRVQQDQKRRDEIAREQLLIEAREHCRELDREWIERQLATPDGRAWAIAMVQQRHQAAPDPSRIP